MKINNFIFLTIILHKLLTTYGYSNSYYQLMGNYSFNLKFTNQNFQDKLYNNFIWEGGSILYENLQLLHHERIILMV